MKPLDRDAIEGAKKALRIQDVYFRDETVRLHPDVTPHFTPEVDKSQFRMTTSVIRDFQVQDPHGEDESKTARFLEIEFKGFVRCLSKPDEGEEATELLSMEVSLGLLYLVKAPLSDASIDEFVRMNAPFHAIPYWREHVHGVCSKRRFKPVTVPLYTRLRAEASAAIDAASAGQDAAASGEGTTPAAP